MSNEQSEKYDYVKTEGSEFILNEDNLKEEWEQEGVNHIAEIIEALNRAIEKEIKESKVLFSSPKENARLFAEKYEPALEGIIKNASSSLDVEHEIREIIVALDKTPNVFRNASNMRMFELLIT